MNDENSRLKEWQNLMEEYDQFFYADDGIYTAALLDGNLEQYNLDFEVIEELIQKLKKFEEKYGALYKDEVENLQRYKEILLELDNGMNGIKEIYNRMKSIYED